jgi:hypothetical protein
MPSVQRALKRSVRARRIRRRSVLGNYKACVSQRD